MICKFCGKNKKLFKAHIIPKAFFTAINKSGVPSRLIADSPDWPSKRSPIGVYDKELVCSDCENKFKETDDYAIKFFRQSSIYGKEVSAIQKKSYFMIDGVNYDLLKLFFISLLWRASASSHIFYQHVQASPFHEDLKRHIDSNDPGGIHDFSVIIWKFDADPEDVAILLPWKNRIEGVLCYNFSFYGFHCLIKSASHSFPAEMHKFLLTPDKALFIGIRDYKGSDYYEIGRDMIAMQQYKVF